MYRLSSAGDGVRLQLRSARHGRLGVGRAEVEGVLGNVSDRRGRVDSDQIYRAPLGRKGFSSDEEQCCAARDAGTGMRDSSGGEPVGPRDEQKVSSPPCPISRTPTRAQCAEADYCRGQLVNSTSANLAILTSALLLTIILTFPGSEGD